MKTIFFSLFILLSVLSRAQLPETVIYLFDVQKNQKGYSIHSPKIISGTKGYNNQPYFTIDGDYLFYVRSMDTVNTEIYRYDMKKKKSKRITKTKEPEYSPKYTPDMENISCVRVEKDKSTQHFYTYNKKGKKPFIILPNLKTIGYYDWMNQNEFLSFELPEPFYLVRHTVNGSKTDTLAKNIGRTFYNLRTKGKIVYIDKTDSLHWKIRTIAPENLKWTNRTKVENPILCETLPMEEDYCFMQDGSILMGHEGKLYLRKNPFKPNTHSDWEEIADLKPFGIDKFYRIAISVENTKLAVVVYKGKKP